MTTQSISDSLSDSGQPDIWQARYTVLLLIWLGSLLLAFNRHLLGTSALFIDMADHLSYMHKGLIASALYIGHTAFQIPAGALADKYGARNLMIIAVICQSLFICLIDMIYRLPFELIVTVYTLLGVSISCFLTPPWKMIATYFPIHKRGRASAIKLSVNMLVPTLIIIVITNIEKIGSIGKINIVDNIGISSLSWLMIFIILGILSLLVAIGIYFYCPDTPCYPSITHADQAELNSEQLPVNAEKTIRTSAFISQSFLWQMLLIWFLFNISLYYITTWLPSYLHIEHELSVAKTGIMAAIPLLFGTVGTLIGGYFADRFNLQNNKLFIAGILFSTVIFGMNNLVSDTHLMLFEQPIPFPAKFMGLTSGIINFAGLLAGGVIAALFMSLLMEQSWIMEYFDFEYNVILISKFTLIVTIACALVMMQVKIRQER